MQRLGQGAVGRERGATAVLVAILMVGLVGFTAIAVDIGAVWWDRKQLQNGADAGALAMAQACAKREPSCDTVVLEDPTNPTTRLFAEANKLTADAQGVVEDMTSNSVTVRTDSIRQHWFAPIVGIKESPLSATATATWFIGAPGSTLPLAFSICEFEAQTKADVDSGVLPAAGDAEIKIEFSKTSKTLCTGPSDNEVPGGFAWLDVGDACSSTIGIDGVVWNDPGKSKSTGCSAEDLEAMQGQVILVPLFDAVGTKKDAPIPEDEDPESNAWYKVYGFAAFQLTGYQFPSISWNCDDCGGGGNALIKGKFVTYVDLSSGLHPAPPTDPSLGILAVNLTK